ncbi:MAG: PqiC family protein [Candidatus Entotheonellia bacterium]
MYRSLLPVVGVVLSVSLLVVTGCIGLQQPSRFYVLSAQPSVDTTSPVVRAERSPAIGLGPLTLPKYLDRPQIVTRTSPYELTFAEFDRWAEPLEANVLRTLAEHLSRQIPTDRIALFPWPRATPIDYQVAVEVTECYGQTEGQSSLVALWSIFNGEGKEALVSRRSRFTAPAGTQEYGAMVAAMSQTVADLSREIAVALSTLATHTAAR